MRNDAPDDRQGRDRLPEPAARFPRDVDPHRDRERLVNVSGARAEVYASTGQMARSLSSEINHEELVARELDWLRMALPEPTVPPEVVLDLTLLVRAGATTEALLQAILRHSLGLLGAERGSILAPDAGGLHLKVLAARTRGRPVHDETRLPLGEGVAGRVYTSGRPAVVPDTAQCPDYLPGAAGPSEGRWLVAVPLDAATERLGVLCLERAVDQPASEAAVELLQAFSAHAAGQWRIVRVYEDLQTRVRELSVLCDISRDLSGSLERDLLLSKIVRSACELLHCGMASLMLFDDDKQTLSIRHAVGLDPSLVNSVRVLPGQGVAGWVAEHGEPLLVEDITRDERFARPGDGGERAGRYTTRSLLSVPLMIGTEMVGVLNVNNKHNNDIFTPRDRDNLCLLASQAAVSVENARLYETLQRLAVTDPLTKLFRRNYFEEQFAQELSRCKRYARPLSVMMLDIDHFKNVNDSYGHQVGDQVLQALAGLLRRYGRKDDVIARYGGEEFVALLVETDAVGARLAGERLREAMVGHTFEVSGAPEPLRITISVGHASFPGDGDDVEALVHRADLALYAAKHGGRNQVRGYEPGLEMPSAPAADRV